MEETSLERVSKSAATPKKKVTIPKDRHAPKKPITAYNLYAADQRVKMKEQNPDRSFGEMNREIGSMWATLSQNEKKPYIDKAEENRECYMKEVEKYQKSDKYKQYLQTVAALQQRQQQKKVEKEQIKQKKSTSSSSKVSKGLSPTPSAGAGSLPLPPPSRPPPLSLKQSFVPGTEIPIFTGQFLLHNRELEVEGRKLRQTTMDQEEENALLSRHVDNMRTQTHRLETDIQAQILQNQRLKQRLVFLQESLTDAFSDVTIPGLNSVPSVDTIGKHLKQVEAVVIGGKLDGDEHSDVVATVRRVASELVERVKERGEGVLEDKT